MAEFLEISLKEALRPALTIAINDLKDPNARKGDFSKTITLPSSKELDKLFNHIFEINVETATFNANKRLDVKYLADEELQLEGYIKLNEIVINDRNEVEYKCQIVGKNGDLFSKIGEKELTDLTGLDTYNHTWTRANIENSWDTSIQEGGLTVPFAFGKGYTYPLIEYGFDQFTDPPTWNVNHLYPAIYAKEYVDRIFSDAGKTYQSNFFESAIFKRLIVPFNGDSLSLSTAQIQDRALKVDNATTGGTLHNITTSYTKVTFPDEVLDDGANYTTGTYTVPSRGYYDFTTVLDLRAQYTPSGNAVPVTLNKFVTVRVGFFVNGVLTGGINHLFLGDPAESIAVAATYDTGVDVAYPSDAHNTFINITTGATPTVSSVTNNYNDPASNRRLVRNELLLSGGDTVEVRVAYDTQKAIDITGDLFVDGSGNYYGGTVTVTAETGKFLVNVTNPSVEEGGDIDMYSAIPVNIKQKDFLKSIMNMFRLEIQPDNDDPNKYIIEPWNDFISNNEVDWSTKLDVSQDLVYEPMGLLQASEYLFKYKDDKDYYNETYKSEYDETYGQRSGLIDNDFVKQLHTTEVIFSATPSVQFPGVDLIIPHIIKNEDTYKQTESNIRILYYGGLQSTASVWSIYSEVAGTDEFYTSYPYSGHFSDPYSPSIDINFGLPKRLYYDSTFSDITVTNNNLFNAYHLPFLKQIAQRDSKLVSGWFYLKPSDIATLDFRLLYFFNGAYFRLQKIENYDPNKPLTKCYFLKVLYSTPFESIQEWANGGKEDIGGSSDGVDIEEPIPVPKKLQRTSDNYAKSSVEIHGKDNYVDDQAYNIKIQGDSNYISANVSEVNIVNGSGNSVIDGVSNVTLINTDNTTVTESNVLYINGIPTGGGATGVVETKSATFTAVNTVRTYLIDTTSGLVQVNLDPANWNEGDVINFKKISNDSNKVDFKVIGGGTVELDTSAFFKQIKTSIPLQYDGSGNWIVL